MSRPALDHIVKWMGAVMALITLALAWFYYDGATQLGSKSELAVSRIKDQQGLAYRYAPTNSQLQNSERWLAARVLENGRQLDDVSLTREKVSVMGQGTYAVSSRNLWFSASDNSDPRNNGKHYQILLPVLFSPTLQILGMRTWAWGWIVFVVLLGRRPLLEGLRVISQSSFWRIILGIAILRLVLVGWDEIVATISDEEEYVTLASQWYYRAAPDWFFRLPVYPLFIALSGATGLPLRLTIELVQLGSVGLLVGAMRLCGVATWACLVIFAWMTLLPQTADWNNYTVTESFYLPLVMAAVATGLLWMSTARLAYGVAGGVLLGLLMNLREERIISLALGLMMTGFFLLQAWRRLGLRWKILAAASPLLLSAVVVDGAFQTAFLLRTGLWAHCTISTPGLGALMTSLFRIPAQERPQKYFWVNEKVRASAAELSPTFRDQQKFYDTDAMNLREQTEKRVGVREYTADGFIWATLLSDAFTDGKPHAVAYRDKMMRQAGEEISQGLAGKEQQAIYMKGTFPLNTATLHYWLHDLLNLLGQCLAVSFLPPVNAPYLRIGETGPKTVDLYNEVTHRCPSLAVEMDATGDTRPGWIKGLWNLIYKVQIGLLWLACAAAVLVPVVMLFTRRGRQTFVAKVGSGALAPLLLLAFVGASRLLFTSMAGIYFYGGIHPRYMLAFTLVSLPVLVLIAEAFLGRLEDSKTRVWETK